MASLMERLARRARAGIERIGERSLRTTDDLPSLEQLPSRIKRVPFPRIADRVPGWLTRDECRALYALAFYLPGSFMEIGPWVGKSTTCITLGIRDSGGAKRLTTCELNPTLDNFRPYGPGVGFFVPADSAEPLTDLSREGFEEAFKPVLTQPGRAVGQLEKNLARVGLRQFVTIVEGDFRHAPAGRYRFVFADTLHSPAEIARNLPALLEFMDAGTVLACHDTNRENEACVRTHVRFRASCTVDRLFIGELAGNT